MEKRNCYSCISKIPHATPALWRTWFLTKVAPNQACENSLKLPSSPQCVSLLFVWHHHVEPLFKVWTFMGHPWEQKGFTTLRFPSNSCAVQLYLTERNRWVGVLDFFLASISCYRLETSPTFLSLPIHWDLYSSVSKNKDCICIFPFLLWCSLFTFSLCCKYLFFPLLESLNQISFLQIHIYINQEFTEDFT